MNKVFRKKKDKLSNSNINVSCHHYKVYIEYLNKTKIVRHGKTIAKTTAGKHVNDVNTGLASGFNRN